MVRSVMEKYAHRPAISERRRRKPLPSSNQTAPQPSLDNEYSHMSYQQVWQNAENTAKALFFCSKAPVFNQTKVAFLSFTSGQYAVFDLACIRLGAVSVHLQTSSNEEQLSHIIKETHSNTLAVSHNYLSTALSLLAHCSCIKRVVILDHDHKDKTHQNSYQDALKTLSKQQTDIELTSLELLIDDGHSLRESIPDFEEQDDELSMLIYTSGSTGTPKGAMYTKKLAAGMWGGTWASLFSDQPTSTFHYMPMSHVAGHSSLKNTFVRGGNCFFASESNLSSFFEDIVLARPTELSLVPRVCEMIYQKFVSELNRRRQTESLVSKEIEQALKHEFRTEVFGGQVNWISCGSAPLSEQMKSFMESLFDLELNIIYGSTEAGAIAVSGQLLSPPVENYKLVDVPELGYSTQDSPYPRGELLIKTQSIIPGYFNHPELDKELFTLDGYYKTGDIFADHQNGKIRYIDRRSNVIKLSQGEFVTTASLEAIYTSSPLVRQIFVYGNSQRSSLLAVVVPKEELLNKYENELNTLKRLISESFRSLAKAYTLNGYEIPRDFIIEPQAFTHGNGLLSDHGKALFPKLRLKYEDKLEKLYESLEQQESSLVSELHQNSAHLTVEEIVLRAATSLIGNDSHEVLTSDNFRDLGGDSLSAVSFATMLEELFQVRVPVDIVISPAYDLKYIIEFIADNNQNGNAPSFEDIHEIGATDVYAEQLKIDKFIDESILKKAHNLPSSEKPQVVLLTGSSGYLGRFLLLDLLEKAEQSDGKVICLVRARDKQQAISRIRDAFSYLDEKISIRLDKLISQRLEVINGDLSQPKFGLESTQWHYLTTEVDTIIHAGALVNHVLPYRDCFDANVVGTAQLIALALENKIKHFSFLSSIAVADRGEREPIDEYQDIRIIEPVRVISDSYASGYATSKWACEVLLREAHQHYGLPVTIFRSSMILAHSKYDNQLNLPDMFTRLLISLIETGIAPKSFYANQGVLPHYDGLPVDFTASAIIRLGSENESEFHTYNLVNPHHDGISLDTFVDWLEEIGVRFHRIEQYSAWYQLFKEAHQQLGEERKAESLWPLIHSYHSPLAAVSGSPIPSKHFESKVAKTKIADFGNGIPRIDKNLINKYFNDLTRLKKVSI
ncbi:hypothetical protein ZX61_01010 [Vibrio sp. VPAP30]|nr:hypothetical protein ZX61_01010 [Vibrio sp. VPAP30]